MIQKRWSAFVLVAFVFVLLACCWVTYLAADPNVWGLFVSQPPVPLHATHVEVFYHSNDVERGITFETEQSFTTIQQFYREQLPQHGWQYRCTVNPLLAVETEAVDTAGGHTVHPTATPTQAPAEVVPPSNVNPGMTDVYERRGARWIGHEQTLEVVIYEHESSEGTGLTNMARLREYKFRLLEHLDPCPA